MTDYLHDILIPRLLEKEKDQNVQKGIVDFYKVFRKKQIKHLIQRFVRVIPKSHAYYHRLGKEFRLIVNKDFVKVFLQVRDILELAGDVPHIIRGSAGCSLVCYLMGITDIDPIKYKISLARFMHDEREDCPDVDMDFPHNVRSDIYEKIFEKWDGKVARISNHIYYKHKSALKEAIRRKGYHRFLPKDVDLDKIFPDEKDRVEVLENAQEIEGQFRGHSLHCGGIVIFDQKVPEDLYLQEFLIKQEKKGAQIKLNKDEVEDMNLIKIDILSNRGLSQLWQISQKPLIGYEHDDAVYSLLASGENIGITYAESRGMRKLFMEMKPKSIEDIACVLALIRPAAAGGGQKMEFLKRCEFFTEPDVEFVIYDDDAIKYISKLIDVDEGKADIYRKAFAKRRTVVKKEFEKILREKNPDMKDEMVSKIMTRLSQLQDYSFCKSHAISYALLVYALAYQKLHNPLQFWQSTLDNCHSSYRKWVHHREAVKFGNLNIDIIGCPVNCYFKKGYWGGASFLPGMYFNIECIKKKGKDVNIAKFKGIIATYRVCNPRKDMKGATKCEDQPKQKSKRSITFVTIGYEDGKYVDLVIWGAHSLNTVHCLEGEGEYVDCKCPWVNVTKLKYCRITNNSQEC